MHVERNAFETEGMNRKIAASQLHTQPALHLAIYRNLPTRNVTLRREHSLSSKGVSVFSLFVAFHVRHTRRMTCTLLITFAAAGAATTRSAARAQTAQLVAQRLQKMSRTAAVAASPAVRNAVLCGAATGCCQKKKPYTTQKILHYETFVAN